MTAELLRRPILWGGLGLTAGAWLLHGLDPSVMHSGGTAVWGAIAVGSGLWWLKGLKGKSNEPIIVPLQAIDRTLLDKEFTAVAAQITRLAEELAEPSEPLIVQQLQQQLTELKGQIDRKSVQVALLGSPAAGKTTLSPLLNLSEAVSLTEINYTDISQPEITQADLILWVTTGDLTDSEFQTLQQLTQNQHPILLVFNKQDQYLPADRPVILQQLRDRVQTLLAAENVVAVTAAPAPVKVRQHQADGTIQERTEQPAPEVNALQDRLQQMLTAEVESLVLATTYRRSQVLKKAVQTELNQVRRTKAQPIIEQYQWIAAAAAFANPLPSLDLLATATINAQMVMDLGGLYQQSFSMEQAKTVTGNLAGQMVKLGLVEMASQAITPLLKSHAVTYVAGGTLQGISAAYLTRLAGLSLVEYFEEQSQSSEASTTFQPDRLIQKLQAVFDQNQRSAFLQTLVKQGMARLVSQPATGTTVSA